jgi:hypothetical protein
MKTTIELNNNNISMDDDTMLSSLYLQVGFLKSENGHKIRIDTLTWCEIDEFGFITLIRKNEFAKKIHIYDKVTLPKPIRTKEQFERLILVLNGG